MSKYIQGQAGQRRAWRFGVASVLAMLVALSLAAQTSAAAATTAAAVKTKSKAVTLVFDGKTLKVPADQFIFTVNYTNYVPVRFVSYALQKSVYWDSKTSTVSVSAPTDKEKIRIDEALMNAIGTPGKPSSVGGQSLTVKPVQVTFKFEGVEKKLPKGQSGYMVGNSIYVPVRFMSESVGTTINWDEKTGQITGMSPAYAAEHGGGKGGTGGGTGGGSAPTYASITAAAEQKLTALKTSCEADLKALALQYLAETDAAKRSQLYAQGEAKLSACETQFNTILADAEKQLTAGGHSTAILADYRREFEEMVEAGKALAESLKG